MAQRSPLLRWTWGLSVASLFGWSWLIMWGLIPGTPAADEIAVDATVRFSIERESNGLLAGVLPGSVQKRDLATIGSLTLKETEDLSITQLCTNVRRLRITPVRGPLAPEPLSLQGLVPPTPLEAMSCSFTRLTTLKDLPFMPHVQDFSAVGCPVASLEGLANAPNLRHLQVGQTAASEWEYGLQEPLGNKWGRSAPGPLDIQELRQLPHLESLSLRGRWIGDAEPILSLSDLRTLSVAYCRLRSIAGIEKLPRLSRVELDGNRIADLSPLLQLPNLKEVTLMGNPHTDANIATFNALEDRGVTILDRPEIRR